VPWYTSRWNGLAPGRSANQGAHQLHYFFHTLSKNAKDGHPFADLFIIWMLSVTYRTAQSGIRAAAARPVQHDPKMPGKLPDIRAR
jgi:hypothetical protein